MRTLTIVLYCTNNNTTQIPNNSALVDIGQLITLKFPILTKLLSILSIPIHPIPIILFSSSFSRDPSV